MTLIEAVKKHQYDVGVYATDIGEEIKWYWEINGGYCSVASHDYFNSPDEAYKSLQEFLPGFKEFDK